MRSRLLPFLAAAAAAGALAAGCGGSEEADQAASDSTTNRPTAAGAMKPASGSVRIKTFMYDPDPVRVKTGTTVTWKNQDDILHTVTSGKRGRPTRVFDKKLELGEEFSHTFEKAGTYPYLCTLHAGMDGTVVVR
jgi:plastocyanin